LGEEASNQEKAKGEALKEEKLETASGEVNACEQPQTERYSGLSGLVKRAGETPISHCEFRYRPTSRGRPEAAEHVVNQCLFGLDRLDDRDC
jgi:hypothetical protein